MENNGNKRLTGTIYLVLLDDDNNVLYDWNEGEKNKDRGIESFRLPVSYNKTITFVIRKDNIRKYFDLVDGCDFIILEE